MAKIARAGGYPQLNLAAAGVRTLSVALPYVMSRAVLRELRVLSKGTDEKDHLRASARYTLGGEPHGVLVSVHLPPAAKELPFVEMEYRRGQVPKRAELPISMLWPRLKNSGPPEPIKGVVNAEFELPSGSSLPVAFPIELAGASTLGEIIGLRFQRREDDKVIYTGWIDARRETVRINFVFTREVPSVGDGPDAALKAAIELLNVVTRGGATNA